MRLRVDERGWVCPQMAGHLDRSVMNYYKPGTVVELDFGHGTVLTDYNAALIAATVAQCATVHLVSRSATGDRPHIEGGVAYNADGVLHLMRLAIERLAADRDPTTC
jgi:hypothetical protein